MGSTSMSLLTQLRSKTQVDCDTLDCTVAQSLGPFQDCTSNQAIAYAELLHPRHSSLITASAKYASELHQSSKYTDVKVEALTVEICMVKLGLQILPYLHGCMHIQVNPFDAYSKSRTIAGAQRIVALFQSLDPAVGKDRVCIKIPSTWEGLQACRTLEAQEINTLATTLFSIEQAAVAAEAGCRYIAPYINELAVHFVKGFIDPAPNTTLPVFAQHYFRMHNYKTQVLPASLVSIEECMVQAGVDHITIAPGLLSALNETSSVDIQFSSLFEESQSIKTATDLSTKNLALIDDEERFRISFTMNGAGSQEIKQVKAINVFADMQRKLEDLIRPYLP